MKRKKKEKKNFFDFLKKKFLKNFKKISNF